MVTRRGNPDQYLQKVGGTYYARVRVPRTLEKYTGQTHIRRTLATGDRIEANRKKHAVVAAIKAELEKMRTTPKPPSGDHGISFAEARVWREELKKLEAVGKHNEAAAVGMLLSEKAEQVEALYGHEKAKKWYRAASTDIEELSSLMDNWMSVSDYKASTKAGHRKALAEVLGFLRDPHAIPADVTRKVAISYIDNELTQRGLAHTTIRDRLVSLGGFWSWMASRNAVPDGVNPWTNHKISKQRNKGSRPPKRAYTDDELIRLLKGNDQVRSWPTYSYLPDLIILGLYTGAREEELCSLLADDIEMHRDHAVIHIKGSKTKAGIRFVGVVHPAPLAVLKKRAKGGGQLFPELKAGGLDDKLSSSAVKAFGRYRRACEVPDGTDFHSFRRNVITALEAAGVNQVAIARFVGHKVGTMAADVYSAGGSKEAAVETARKVLFSASVVA